MQYTYTHIYVNAHILLKIDGMTASESKTAPPVTYKTTITGPQKLLEPSKNLQLPFLLSHVTYRGKMEILRRHSDKQFPNDFLTGAVTLVPCPAYIVSYPQMPFQCFSDSRG